MSDPPIKRIGMRELLQANPIRSKGLALTAALETFDLDKCETFNDVARGYNLIFRLFWEIGIIGGEDTRRTLDGMMRALDGFARHKKTYMEVDFPAQLVKKIEAAVKDRDKLMHSALRKILTADQYKEFENLMNQANDINEST